MSLLFVGHPNERDLALFAGGELGPLARWRIEKHLQNCSRCEELVADFFHLQGELAELAELPPVDWSAQARVILERAQQQPAASTQRGFGGLFPQPLALRAGLAMAAVLCAVVVIRQFPEQEKTARPEVAVVADNLFATKRRNRLRNWGKPKLMAWKLMAWKRLVRRRCRRPPKQRRCPTRSRRTRAGRKGTGPKRKRNFARRSRLGSEMRLGRNRKKLAPAIRWGGSLCWRRTWQPPRPRKACGKRRRLSLRRWRKARSRARRASFSKGPGVPLRRRTLR